MNSHTISFDGAILQRGFWLYVCRITCEKEVLLYVGRTGDSSSINAGSLFSRISRQLEQKPESKSNSLTKKLIEKRVTNLTKCHFEFTGFGPLALEQETDVDHQKYRDQSAALEKQLALYLKRQGYFVIGVHPKERPFDKTLFSKITKQIDTLFPKSEG